jgi:MFS-type transporter involved in bile tolerance (Atg22 family)
MTFSTKIAAILGPLLYGTISSRTGNPRIAILSLEAFFVIGLFFMLLIPGTDHRGGAESAESVENNPG